jgi:hypothetical protein
MTYYYGMETTSRGRPPKAPEDRRTNGLRIPLTDVEREIVENAAQGDGEKPITYEALLRAAKRRASK